MELNNILLYIFIGVSNLSLAIFSYSEDKKDPIHRCFAAFCGLVSLWILSLGLAFHYVNSAPLLSFIGVRTAYFSSLLFMAALSCFFFYFPNRNKKGFKFLMAFNVFSLILAGASAFTPLIHQEQIIENGLYVGEKLGPLYGIYMMTTLLHFALAFIWSFKKSIQNKGLKRKTSLIAGLGLFLFFSAGMLVKVILPAQGIWILKEEGIFFSLFFAIPSFFAIHKLRLFHISSEKINHLQRLLLVCFFFIISILIDQFLIPEEQASLSYILQILFLIGVYHFILWLIPTLKGVTESHILNEVSAFKNKIHTLKSLDEINAALEHHFVLNAHFKEAILQIGKHIAAKPTYHFSLKADNSIIACLHFSSKGKASKKVHKELKSLSRWLENQLTSILVTSQLEEENQVIKELIVKKTKQLQEVAEQQKEFMSMTAHEFRTPLNIALIQLEDLLEEIDNKDIKKSYEQMQKMRGLIDRLFKAQAYELEKIQIQKQKVNASEFFKERSLEYSPLAAQKEVKIIWKDQTKGKTKLHLDTEQMEHYIQNIISNAIKFSPEEGQIHCSLFIKANKLHYKVCDEGPGVPDKLKKEVFSKYKKGNYSKGIGLGLYLCTQIANLHKAKIVLTDNKNKGACFSFVLPLKGSEQDA